VSFLSKSTLKHDPSTYLRQKLQAIQLYASSKDEMGSLMWTYLEGQVGMLSEIAMDLDLVEVESELEVARQAFGERASRAAIRATEARLERMGV
jgi:hypothetical protein